METQLLDGVLVIGFIVEEDDARYAGSKVYRLDIEGEHFEEFIKYLEEAPGLVHMDEVKA